MAYTKIAHSPIPVFELHCGDAMYRSTQTLNQRYLTYGVCLSGVIIVGLNVEMLKVTYHPLYSMNKFVTNKSKLPQDGA